jgi:hypothetical protein
VDFAQRAAAHAMAPHLQDLAHQNAELQRQLAVEARRNLDQRLERAVPNFREVDRDPRWHPKGSDLAGLDWERPTPNISCTDRKQHRGVGICGRHSAFPDQNHGAIMEGNARALPTSTCSTRPCRAEGQARARPVVGVACAGRRPARPSRPPSDRAGCPFRRAIAAPRAASLLRRGVRASRRSSNGPRNSSRMIRWTS